MNRENKRKTYQKGYYKSHACNDSFTCKVCGRLMTPETAGTGHRNHCSNCLSSLHVDEEPGDRAADCGGIMEPVAGGPAKTASGLLSTAAGVVASSAPTALRRTTTP